MNESIHYGHVYECIREIVEGEAKRLIEAVAEVIASELFIRFPQLQSCTVKVIKPGAPIPGNLDSVAVEIYRERKKMNQVYIGLGTNIEPRESYLKKSNSSIIST